MDIPQLRHSGASKSNAWQGEHSRSGKLVGKVTMNLIQTIVWARAITPRDQILILRMLDTHGTQPFDADINNLAEMMSLPKSSIYECIKRLKSIDWLETEPVYLDGTYRSLKKRSKTRYRVKLEIKKEADRSPPEF